MGLKIAAGLMLILSVVLISNNISVAQDTAAALVPEDMLKRILSRLESIYKRQKSMQREINSKLDQILANQEAMQKELKTIKYRASR